MADGAAEVPLVDAVEMVRRSKVHRLRDFTDCGAVFNPSPDFLKSCVLYRFVQRFAPDG